MNKQAIAVIVITLSLGLGAGYWFGSRSPADGEMAKSSEGARQPLFYRNPMNPTITSPVPAKDDMGMDYIPVYAEEDSKKERKVLFYRNPMNPAVTSPVPAKDGMGMDYIPVYAQGGDSSEPAGTVIIDPVTVQNIGVRTARAELRAISHTVRSVGRVAFDEQRLTRLHPKIKGWIEELHVDKTGQPVKKNTVLLSIYSPQLVSSQQEYLLALKNLEILSNSAIADIRQGAEELVKSSRERLQLMDVPEHQIRELEQTGQVKKSLHIHSPAKGIVMKVGARRGQYVTPKTLLYMIADLSKVWVYVNIYEQELPWVKVGDRAEMQLVGIPGRTFRGKVSYIYPFAEAKTRTIKVRLEFSNSDLALKPDMFADITLHTATQREAVVIPAEAVLRSGTREQVFVVREPGKFEPREVKLGISSEGYTQILEGLAAGEEVVTSAQFLIDSESKLREATAKMLQTIKAEAASQDKVAPDQSLTKQKAGEKNSSHEQMDHSSHQEMNHD